ncbi:MAG: hypothetical protein FWE95_08865, partial [Planctomycetaceae bacterium]|nr:hypothetical protein [Planctomycetaceae bacterium]
MYKLFLCWRYLLTRYIALASVISVMLGVATMIVVNAVMLGFTSEMKDRIHGILADVIFQTYDLNKGFPLYEWHRAKILEVAGDLIEELTPTAVTLGMLTYQNEWMENPASFQVDIVGIDVRTQGKVSKIAEYLQHPENRRMLSFDLLEDAYDVQKDGGPIREQLEHAGWERRRWVADQIRRQRELNALQNPAPQNEDAGPIDPFAEVLRPDLQTFDSATDQHAGIIVGIGTSLYRRTSDIDPATGKKMVTDDLMLVPGDDVSLFFPTA